MVQCLIMKYSALFESGPHPPCPPYVHLMSTRHHSCDRCSQAFPVIRHSSSGSVYYCEHKPNTWGGGGGGGGGGSLVPRPCAFVACSTNFRTASDERAGPGNEARGGNEDRT